MRQLRGFLADTVNLQIQFLVSRLDQALPKLLAEAAPVEREKVRQNFERLTRSPGGCYALIDYVNFKGEGTLATERYQGKGWGFFRSSSICRRIRLIRPDNSPRPLPLSSGKGSAMPLRAAMKNVGYRVGFAA